MKVKISCRDGYDAMHVVFAGEVQSDDKSLQDGKVELFHAHYGCHFHGFIPFGVLELTPVE